MHHHILKNNFGRWYGGLVATVIAVSGAAADEVNHGKNDWGSEQTVAVSNFALAPAWPTTIDSERTSKLRLPQMQSQSASFVEKCAELEAIPLIDIVEQADQQVYFGINFDGFLGFYARL